MNVGEKIKFRRKELGLTQEEVCKGICSITYISKLENNKIEGQDYIIEALCKKLNLNYAEVMNNKFDFYMTILRELYKHLSDKDLEFVEMKIDQLHELKNVNDPAIRLGSEIILFGYYIFKSEKVKSTLLREIIIKNENFLPYEIKVWYFKFLGLYEYVFGDINKSINYFYKAKELLNIDQSDEAHLEYLLGLANTRLMLISKSIIHTEKALELYEKEIKIKKIIDCKFLMGINYNRSENYEMAENTFLTMVDTLKSINDYETLGKVYHNLGYLYSLTNRSENAINYFQRALTTKQESDDRLSSIYLLAYEYKKQNKLELVLNLCNEGLKLSHKSNLYFYYKIYILRQSLFGFMDEKFIIDLENKIIPYFKEKDPSVACECYHLLAQIFYESNKYKAASKYYKLAIKFGFINKRKELLF